MGMPGKVRVGMLHSAVGMPVRVYKVGAHQQFLVAKQVRNLPLRDQGAGIQDESAVRNVL